MSRIIVTGAGGQLGTELLRVPSPPGITTIGWSGGLDITDATAVAGAIREADLVINAAAYTKVDLAEAHPAAAFHANAFGPQVLAEACAHRGLPLIHVSTDYVFGGGNDHAWVEEDAVAPLNVYGRSKAAGEDAIRHVLDAHIIVRTSWLYAEHGANFVRTILAAGERQDELRVVDDQRGTPTAAVDLAAALMVIAARLLSGERNVFGTYHYAASDSTTWFGLAEAVFDRVEPVWRRRPIVRPITSSERPTAARRPANSVLDSGKIMSTFAPVRRPWREALDEVVDRLRIQAPVHRSDATFHGAAPHPANVVRNTP